ncbi:RluA family pseudouridine synthase [endosymbiont GvMRE of Glomus versiforme]|uniref:RluA family pseudouridine synthase n=1 Tax=endosymbiont GvMRE of Glomus versiforme TaxID=2039283 RepID=UPI000EE3C4ED|nr:RluA family pseudouridine synthase [endosymbiont GvMRE of Glomus versiforme]RHZ37648.1 Pseudouridine synthase [endosymbiont GvMRE of Glomus versiforme]
MINIIYQDQNLLVVNKPNNLVVQKTKDYAESLEEILIKYEPLLASVSRWGIVHRLDRQTTGLLLVAKNSESFNYLTALFAKRKIQKTYLALVEGVLVNESGEITFYVQTKFPNKGKIRMDLNAQQGRLVQISFQVIERLNNYTFLRIFPLTGRTHQIRLAFQKINHPIYNDPLYGSVCINPEIGQFLHAYGLEFFGPKKEKFLFQTPLPDFFQNKLKELKSQIWNKYSS